jgi:phosphatidylinositol alpha-1,6-mannosyltransferase
MEGGIARAVDAWASGLAEVGHEVRLLAFLPEAALQGCPEPGSAPYGVRIVPLAERVGSRADRLLPIRKARSAVHLAGRVGTMSRETIRALGEFRPDVVFLATMNSETGILGSLARLAEFRVAAAAYGSELMPARNPGGPAVRRRLSIPDVWIAISKYTRGLLEAWGVPRGRVRIVHPAVKAPGRGAPESVLYDISRPEGEPVRLLSVCRLVERKGVQDVLEAVKMLRKRGANVTYEVVGDGPYRSVLERKRHELGLEEVVVFRGRCGDAERDAAFRACDIFVLMPFEADDGDVEGFGIVFLEAGACGKPVIGSRSGGIPEAVADDETGLLVEPRSTFEIAEAVQRLSFDRDLRERLGQAGAAAYAAHAPRTIGYQLAEALKVGGLDCALPRGAA